VVSLNLAHPVYRFKFSETYATQNINSFEVGLVIAIASCGGFVQLYINGLFGISSGKWWYWVCPSLFCFSCIWCDQFGFISWLWHRLRTTLTSQYHV